MKYKICVEGFGKIKYAEMELAPLTFFVGDNNSGKSYLLSLIWALHSTDAMTSLFNGLADLRIESANRIRRIVTDMLQQAQNESKVTVAIESRDLANVINKLLENNKDIFVSNIFNSKEVKVNRIWIELIEEEQVVVKSVQSNQRIMFSYNRSSCSIPLRRISSDSKFMVRFLQMRILESWLAGNINHSIYLPAARTGFMLSKDIINKVGRQEVFDFVNEFERVDNVLQPFTKPIIEFLNEIESVSVENMSKFEDIVNWVERGMMNGNIRYEETGKKEIRYIPHGQETSIPLRVTSAIVTELTPLIVLLKYKHFFNELCYEEPEMCLHPQLQLKMGQLLVRMVNAGLHIIATTHSDIMLQHVNNMCRLKEMGMPTEILEQFGLDITDGVGKEKVAVYQFTDRGSYSTVERIPYTDGGFQIPTFQDALMNILEQTSQIQDYEE